VCQPEPKKSKKQEQYAHCGHDAKPARRRLLARRIEREQRGAGTRQRCNARVELGDFRRVGAQNTRLIQSIANFFQCSSFEARRGAFYTARETAASHARFERSPAGAAGVPLSHAARLCKFDAEMDNPMRLTRRVAIRRLDWIRSERPIKWGR
jgi:hypothetical protein